MNTNIYNALEIFDNNTDMEIPKIQAKGKKNPKQNINFKEDQNKIFTSRIDNISKLNELLTFGENNFSKFNQINLASFFMKCADLINQTPSSKIQNRILPITKRVTKIINIDIGNFSQIVHGLGSLQMKNESVKKWIETRFKKISEHFNDPKELYLFLSGINGIYESNTYTFSKRVPSILKNNFTEKEQEQFPVNLRIALIELAPLESKKHTDFIIQNLTKYENNELCIFLRSIKQTPNRNEFLPVIEKQIAESKTIESTTFGVAFHLFNKYHYQPKILTEVFLKTLSNDPNAIEVWDQITVLKTLAEHKVQNDQLIQIAKKLVDALPKVYKQDQLNFIEAANYYLKNDPETLKKLKEIG